MGSIQLNLVVLRSPDIDRAARFYTGLGLTLDRHSHGTGPEHYAAEICGVVFEIYPLSEKSSPSTGARVGFQVDDVDGLVPQITELGGVLVSAPSKSEWGRRAVIKDPDGHTVELITLARPASTL